MRAICEKDQQSLHLDEIRLGLIGESGTGAGRLRKGDGGPGAGVGATPCEPRGLVVRGPLVRPAGDDETV